MKLTCYIAGITNGQDMMAAYIRDTWPGPVANAVLAIADVGGRSVNMITVGQSKEPGSVGRFSRRQ